jgi:hypothetical protein
LARATFWQGQRFGKGNILARATFWQGQRFGKGNILARATFWQGQRFGKGTTLVVPPRTNFKDKGFSPRGSPPETAKDNLWLMRQK